ncbi:MAG TPA: hypothetical protein ENN73_02450 [Firmicutes bacterium]|nr:hypothetical protein [Bacillota bacterium]
MTAKKRFKKPHDPQKKTESVPFDPGGFEEIEPIETGWDFHKVPLIVSVVIAVIFYILVFIFVK